MVQQLTQLFSHFPHQYDGTRTTKWLTADELEYAKLRVKYVAGPNAPTYEFRWDDVFAAAKDRKTWVSEKEANCRGHNYSGG